MEEGEMGGMIPLGDASRRPTRAPVVTILIILVNSFVFVRELMGGEAFVIQWSVIPAQIISGHQWITILAAMFMHASWFGKAGVGGSTPSLATTFQRL